MFAVATLDLEHKTFIIYVATLNVDLGDKMHLSKKVQIAHLEADEASIKFFSKYVDFANVFSLVLAIELPEHTRINNYAIELVNN